jgi:hypothetical protein
MERVETYSKELMFTATKSAKGDGHSIKLKGDQAARLYIQGGASKPDSRQFPDCACCTHTLTDMPKENKAAKKENDRISKESGVNKRKIAVWKENKGPPLIVDGKIVTEWKPPKMKDLLIVCHCLQNYESDVIGGSKCLLVCFDKNTKKQYPKGECPVCKCSCKFVSSTA